jgi:hypothetical protein
MLVMEVTPLELGCMHAQHGIVGTSGLEHPVPKPTATDSPQWHATLLRDRFRIGHHESIV